MYGRTNVDVNWKDIDEVAGVIAEEYFWLPPAEIYAMASEQVRAFCEYEDEDHGFEEP